MCEKKSCPSKIRTFTAQNKLLIKAENITNLTGISVPSLKIFSRKKTPYNKEFT